jgi:hypothetical protein
MTTEQKPDFSGEYVLNRQASTLSPGADAVRSALLRIEHREPTVRVEAAFHFEGKTFEYTIELSSEGREDLDPAGPRHHRAYAGQETLSSSSSSNETQGRTRR